MQITFLGTSASEGFPNAFCGCASCMGARTAGGSNIRRRSSALIDDVLLIDLGPDLMAASAAFNIPLHGVQYVLQTHEHIDHLDPSHFVSRSASCGVPDTQELTWLASAGAAHLAASRFRHDATAALFHEPDLVERLCLRLRQISAYETTCIGPYRILSVPAAHGGTIDALLHAIERDGRRLFYATDTGPLPEEVWEALADEGWAFDVVVMDHTFGLGKRSSGHLNSEQFCEQMAEMRRFGLAHDGTRFLATHIAHHSNPLHDELVSFAAERGYGVAFDGLVVDV
jgi:phosphoribosyl 1,2-cyclic phosphate phosphodiesterase